VENSPFSEHTAYTTVVTVVLKTACFAIASSLSIVAVWDPAIAVSRKYELARE
jgi:hypothetical protein